MTSHTLTLPRLDPRLPYFLDAIVSATMGLTCILLAGPLTAMAGWSLPPEFILGLGIFLVPWGGINYLTSQLPSPAPVVLVANLAVDALWALGSMVLLAMLGSELSPAGWALIIVQAFGVLGAFVAKLAGFKGFSR